jgi:hypothetical protein
MGVSVVRAHSEAKSQGSSVGRAAKISVSFYSRNSYNMRRLENISYYPHNKSWYLLAHKREDKRRFNHKIIYLKHKLKYSIIIT